MKAADGARRVAISSAKWDVCMCRARVISNEFSFHYYKLFSRFIAFYRVKRKFIPRHLDVLLLGIETSIKLYEHVFTLAKHN